MDLLFLRHAEAVELGVDGIANDSERPLTIDGIKKMEKAAQGMQQLGLNLDLILTSPLKRAIQTAEITAKEFGIQDKIRISNHLAPNGNHSKLVVEILGLKQPVEQVLLVGHEPDLSRLVSFLLTGQHTVAINFKKAALLQITVSNLIYGQCAALSWFLTCKQLIKLR
jgi:phosphohistidine phosphatase